MPGTALQPELAMLTASADGFKPPLPLLPAAAEVAGTPTAATLLLLVSRASGAVAKRASAVALLLADWGDSSASPLQ